MTGRPAGAQGRRGEAGYAVLAAMLAAAGFSIVTLQVVTSARSGVKTAAADLTRARLAAAADAGVALAVEGLSTDDPNARWPADGTLRQDRFDGVDLAIRVEDERGKIPLNQITPTQARAMFQRAGAAPSDLDALTTAFQDARDPSRHPGALAQGASEGFDDVSDLARTPGVTPALYAAIAPFATVSAGDAAFDAKAASPFALEVMQGLDPASPQVIERQRELDGERPALSPGALPSLVGHPLTVQVEASTPPDGRYRLSERLELTPGHGQGYVVRARTS